MLILLLHERNLHVQVQGSSSRKVLTRRHNILDRLVIRDVNVVRLR